MKQLNKQLQAHFDEMCKTGKLFKVAVTGKQIWDVYLNSFPKDSIFRDPASSVYNCNICNNFIRRYGNIVTIDENLNITSLFSLDINAVDEEYKDAVRNMNKLILESTVEDIFFETFDELKSLPYEACTKHTEKFKLGIPVNIKRYTPEEVAVFGRVNAQDEYTFHHMCVSLPQVFVDMSGKSIEAIQSGYRDDKNVFQRAMETISLDTLKLVKDLINQDSLLDGKTHLFKIEQFIPLKKEYDELPASKRNNWCWIKSYKLPIAKFRNELIGVLCTALSEGEELNKACQDWNRRVDPANYMKAVAPFTERMKQDAIRVVQELGCEDSFDRRLATMDDIRVTEILHANIGEDRVKSISIFDNIKPTSTRHKRSEFDGVEEVSIDNFMQNILPNCSSVEAFVTNNLENNFVSLTTSKNQDSKPIFKWDNNYSWTFNGNLAGKSQIKEEVRSKGGKVDGVLRFSMMWADGNNDNSDLDLHCVEPSGGTHIYYANRISNRTRGNLDIDIMQPNGKLAVENITYPRSNSMIEGTYRLYINQFANRSSKGFKAEIEFQGELYSYVYNKAVNGNIDIAEVTLKNGIFSIKHILQPVDGLGINKEIYGIETNQFHKVNLICLSPNHWGKNNVGNKHYLFMLSNARVPNIIRSFHSENLIPELATQRKVLEVVGQTAMVEPTEKQLSGLGFNATVRDELIVKLSGNFKRVIKIKF